MSNLAMSKLKRALQVRRLFQCISALATMRLADEPTICGWSIHFDAHV